MFPLEYDIGKGIKYSGRSCRELWACPKLRIGSIGEIKE